MNSNVYSLWEAGRDIAESTGMVRFEVAQRLINAHLAHVKDASALLLVDPDHLKLSCHHLTHQLIDTEYLQPLRVLLRELCGHHALIFGGNSAFAIHAPDAKRAVPLAHLIREQVETQLTGRAEDVRREAHPFYGPHTPVLTVCVGVAIARPGSTLSDLIRMAEAAKDRAKMEGRNRVVVTE